jgi:hypothetical protein
MNATRNSLTILPGGNWDDGERIHVTFHGTLTTVNEVHNHFGFGIFAVLGVFCTIYLSFQILYKMFIWFGWWQKIKNLLIAYVWEKAFPSRNAASQTNLIPAQPIRTPTPHQPIHTPTTLPHRTTPATPHSNRTTPATPHSNRTTPATPHSNRTPTTPHLNRTPTTQHSNRTPTTHQFSTPILKHSPPIFDWPKTEPKTPSSTTPDVPYARIC